MLRSLFRSLFFCLGLSVVLGQVPLHAASRTTKARHAHGTYQPAGHSARRASASKASGRASSRGGRREVVRSRVVRGRNGRLVRVAVRGRRGRVYERFSGNSFADDVTQGDITDGEDPVVRQAAIAALSGMNGTAVAIDPDTGRILAMVNQKLALSSGAEPCSTIKVSVALAGLSEHLVTKDSALQLGRHDSVTLTEALAHSNNLYFETLGRKLGFERVKKYANMFGLGELAGWNIKGEQLGTYPSAPLPESRGGVGRMCSFGEGVSMTPLQLGAIVAAIANGGTLNYLQHPTTPDEAINFVTREKRKLDIKPYISDIETGMQGAVDYGTARSLHTNFTELPVLGKTGTCSSNGTRYGWFASFANTDLGRIVTVFFLEGGRPTFGPKAAELTGIFYRNLYDHRYFAAKGSPMPVVPDAIPAPAVTQQ